MKEIVAQQLEAKCKEHAELTKREIYLSLQIVSTHNAMYRFRWQGDRKRISQAVARVAREIEGLASILQEQDHEPIAA